ncbi:unnamed protein product [Macrosiphum euphorbiae]|uniref:Nuclease HARBI1 n=1 Tax=Macrosiphum euphorbiae TaxID=13131 RepID=A0AAV0WS68_9HEMI|nr:unnamed protein product [Macrosiphum euphorbiae]
MEEACIAIIVALATDNADEGRKRKKKQRIWSKEWFLKRNKYTHHNLLDELLLTSNEDYANFLRMDHSTFMELLEKVEPYIKKKDTNMRSAIPANQRLSTTLRYLATGQSFEDLKFTTAIAPQTLSKIIIETCEALVIVLKDCIQVS